MPGASASDPDDVVVLHLGVVPLLLGHGAGAEMRFALGVAVFAGMLAVTVFGIFMTPVFFVVILWLTRPKAVPADKAATLEVAHEAAPNTVITRSDGQTAPSEPEHSGT